jgi:serine/threonine-protein kinase
MAQAAQIGQKIGNYRLVRVLGEGGLGSVFEGVRDDIGGRAAVKLLHPEFARSPEAVTRFTNEARAANLVEHPSVVKIFDHGVLADGRAFLAMELCEGEVLSTRLNSIPTRCASGASSPPGSRRRTRSAWCTAISSPPT